MIDNFYLDLASLSCTFVTAPAGNPADIGVDRRGKNGESETWLSPRRGVLKIQANKKLRSHTFFTTSSYTAHLYLQQMALL